MEREFKIINSRLEGDSISVDLNHYHSVMITESILSVWGSYEVQVRPQQKRECKLLFEELKEYFQQRTSPLKPLDPFWYGKGHHMVELSEIINKVRDTLLNHTLEGIEMPLLENYKAENIEDIVKRATKKIDTSKSSKKHIPYDYIPP